ncbi:FKBP-type peptidyl-prolyl cis-trans isomerase [Reichenbachiella sp.]|uniref:FKBP-type peptidyl-prolyl cis-trans isomerase n=1 Tax=Reichenbachiella sp. TaxID=2184521 RepID=UPI003B5B197A
MRFRKHILLSVLMGGLIYFGGCVDHAAEDEQALEQLRLDSLAQAESEGVLFDAYIADPENGINADDVVVQDDGVRRVVWNPSTSVRVPEFNDIVSVHYVGKFTNNEVFDTTNPQVAKESDSLNYVDIGISFDDLLAKSDKTYEELLDSLNTSTGAISDPVFTLNRIYVPMAFNHQADGTGISFSFILGFRSGLRNLMLEMEMNSKGLIMIPSAVAYGTVGSAFDAEGNQNIPPNTPLIFEFELVNIRP